MDWLPTWMTSYYFMGAMAVLAVGLIAVFLILRNRRSEEDD